MGHWRTTMPIYEYHCEACGSFERLQKLSDTILTQCPKCHKPVKKMMSQSSFQLKGGGWYKDGYSPPQSSSAKPEKSEKSDKKETTPSDKSSDKPSDKPA